MRIYQCQAGYVFGYAAGLTYEGQQENEPLEPRGFEALIEIFPKSLYNGGRKCAR